MKYNKTHQHAPAVLCSGIKNKKNNIMASGTSNKLTGQVGEHLVSAVLGTLGYYASPYSGNVPGFDVTAVHSESLKSFPVQVKASTKGALVQSTIDKWCNHSIDENNWEMLSGYQ